MKFNYETQGTSTYLVYKIEESDEIDSMSLGMLTNNRIPGLAPTVFTQMDADKYIKYNVSAKISVSQFFSGVVNRKRLVGVFNGIADAMLSAEEYMIDPSTISLDLEYVFADVSSCDAELICLPIVTEQKEINLSMFFKNILFSTQFDQTENCDYVAKLMNYLNSTPVIVLKDFKKILMELNNESAHNANGVVKTPPVQKVVSVPQPQPIVTPIPQQQEKKSDSSATQIPQAQKQRVSVPSVVDNKEETKSEKRIGMFDLLMHYSKENVELYKAQKASGKASKATPAPPQNAKKTPSVPTNFTVPGRSSTGFAIPGQQVPSVSTPTVQPSVQTPPMSTKVAQPSQPVYTPPQQPIPQTKQTSFGETTVLGGGKIGETTVLNAVNPSQTASPYLVRLKNNERIPLNKPVFRVGKERSYVDYFIGDNTAISRSHANFITRDGEYFVVDTNSTNHTFVNGTMIQSNDEVRINDGDKIRLANEDFDFKLY